MDLRQILAQFDAAKNLRRIQASVNPDLELAALCRREFSKLDGSALLFQQLTGFKFRSAANLFGSDQRMARILRCANFQQFSEKVKLQFQEQQGPANECLKKIAEAASRAELNQNPLWRKQAEATLLDLPALKSWPQELKPYFTLPLVITRHPLTGAQNLGLYRVQVLNEKQAAINFQPGSGAGYHLAVALEQQLELPVALVFGGDLALYWLAAAPLPSGCDEYKLFQALFAEELMLAKGCTQDLSVPGDAEFVVEGFISPGMTCSEGPFGNHTGQYVTRDDCPVMQMTSIAWREQPIMPFTVVGPPPSENVYLAKANEILIREMLRVDYPDIIDLRMPELTIFHGAALVQVIRGGKQKAGDLIERLWRNSPLRNAKLLMLFDSDIDLASYEQAYWRLVNQLDSSRIYQQGKQVAIDATGVDQKILVVENKAIRALLQRRKSEYDS